MTLVQTEKFIKAGNSGYLLIVFFIKDIGSDVLASST